MPSHDSTTSNIKNRGRRRERDFFGFETVTIEQRKGFNEEIENPYEISSLPELYRSTEQLYDNKNYYLKGAILKESVKDADGDVWTETSTAYGFFEPDNAVTVIPDGFDPETYTLTDPIPNIDEVTGSGGCLSPYDYSRIFVTPIVSIKKFTEGDDAAAKYAVTVNEEFDAHGNITQFRDYGEQDDDVYVAKIQYLAPIAGIDNSYGYPEYLRIYDAAGTLLRQRQAAYNASGDLEQVITKLNGSENSTVSLEYDTYGNITKVTHEDSLEDSDDSGSDAFFREYTYDDVVHTFPVRVEDAFGYFSTAEYNFLFGVPVYTTDMNLQPMRTRLDDRGRTVEVTGPYELFVEGVEGAGEPGWTIRFEYHGEDVENPVAESVADFAIDQFGPVVADGYNGIIDATQSFTGTLGLRHALTRHFDPEFRAGPENMATENQILTSTLVDGFGKVVQVKKSGVVFDGSASSSINNEGNIDVTSDNVRVWLLNPKTLDDGFGRAAETYHPTFQSDNFDGLATDVSFVPGAAYQYDAAANQDAPPTVTTYDVLDRPLTTTMPGETSQSVMEYAIEEGMFVTTVTNELNQIQKKTTDIRQRTVKTTQESVTGFITTTFNYNNLGELLKVIDVAGNETESKYDLAGRRTELRHEDNGLTKFTYDKAGNLKWRETSNLILGGVGEKIKYKYNYSRLSEINYDQFPENKVQYFYGTSGNSDASNDNSVGRLWYQADASGAQYYKYGRLGEVIRNRRSVAVPGDRVYWFQTDWTYDTWNRVKTIKYPDEEEVTYHYNHGGNLHGISTTKPSQGYGKNIISQLNYDHFGQRAYLRYGNGTDTHYTYEQDRRRLSQMQVGSSTANGAGVTDRTFIDNLYDYDVLSNVRGIYNNTVELPANDQIGGRTWQQYTYDDLNRLTTATGHFMGRDEPDTYAHHKYTLSMSYDSQHNILLKTQVHEAATSNNDTPADWTQVEASTYALDYQDYNTGEFEVGDYNYAQPHAPRTIIDQPVAPGCCDGETDPRVKTKTFEYDANGNQKRILEKICTAEEAEAIRENLWDNEDRLRAVDMNPNATEIHPIAVYTYDAGGERIIKHNATSITIYESGENVGTLLESDYMIYPSGMLVARSVGDGSGNLTYTKHYFDGAQRLSSKIGTTTNLGQFLEEWTLQENGSGLAPLNMVVTSQDQLTLSEEGLAHVYELFEMDEPTITSNGSFLTVPAFIHGAAESEHYFFHPDHLGSASYITGITGAVTQHIEYFAFGETFVEEHLNSHNSPFKFNGKELDEETGNYYFGARYYDPRMSLWVSVDPLASYDPVEEVEHYIEGEHNGGVYNPANFSVYGYCYQNPVRYIDPNGKQVDVFIREFKNDILKFANKVDKIFNQNKHSKVLPNSGVTKTTTVGAVKMTHTSGIRHVSKEERNPQTEQYLKTSYHNQRHPDNKLKLDGLIGQGILSTNFETFVSDEVNYQTPFLVQINIKVDVATNLETKKETSNMTSTIGFNGSGLYYSSDKEKNNEVGIRLKSKDGKGGTTESKTGIRWQNEK